MTGEPQANMPNSWEAADLCEVAELNPRLDKSAHAGNLMVSFVPMPRVEAGTGTIDVSQTRSLEEVKKGYTPFREGDVLFAKITPCMENGKMAVVPPLKNGLGFGSTEFHVLRPYCEISAQYIYFFVSSESFRRDAEHNMTGAVGQRRVPISYLADQSVPVPPAREQRRIVAKIEELFSELDKGIESLKAARAKLNIYRQAVLKHAFEGKLTAQWREENKDKLETPEQLLAHIKQEREARYEQQLQEWKAAVKEWEGNSKSGKKPQRPKKLPKVTDLLHDVTAKLPPLPESWIWEKLGWMTCGVEYGTAAKSATTGRVPVLRMGNIQNTKFDWADLVYTSDENEIAAYLLHDGDILFNRTNSPELVGKTAIYKGERPAVFAGYLIRVNHIRTIVDGQYLNLFLNSHIARQYGNNVKTDGVNQSNINGAKLSNYPFPYCSIEEQREIASILEKTFSLLDETEADIVQELQKADALRQSVLKKAFTGQLVPQDPSDEPASVLLDRIKAAREKAAQNNHSKKTRKKKTTA
ncbi:MAG: restriction endonuclease subunit S [Gemmatimonadetes bacterium]|nr:restriction endonuclease subunit S [Gemmatimonadota bacterium]